MKLMIAQIVILILISSATFAVAFQGEIIKIKDNQITIEIFGDQPPSFETGLHINLAPVPKGSPTLDMLKG